MVITGACFACIYISIHPGCVSVQVLHPAAMQPLQTLSNDVLIRVRNSYNLAAGGSLIVKDRHQGDGGLITSIVLKEGRHLSPSHTHLCRRHHIPVWVGQHPACFECSHRCRMVHGLGRAQMQGLVRWLPVLYFIRLRVHERTDSACWRAWCSVQLPGKPRGGSASGIAGFLRGVVAQRGQRLVGKIAHPYRLMCVAVQMFISWILCPLACWETSDSLPKCSASSRRRRSRWMSWQRLKSLCP